LVASSLVAVPSSSAGTTELARPSVSASVAGIVRGKYNNSVAFAWPTSRGRVHEMPVSQDSAMPAKAKLKPAVSATIRKSQAKAIDAPAPAATPLTEAITGFGISASASAIGA
jgi:hypothetical protein